MECPVCSNKLTEVSVGEFEIDVCQIGCGGIWFDAGELEKCDQAHEQFPSELLRVKSNADVVVDMMKVRLCPKCSEQELHKRFYDSQYNVEVDECPSCSGYWLDIGELGLLRKQDKVSTERGQVIEDYVAERVSDDMEAGEVNKLRAFFELIF